MLLTETANTYNVDCAGAVRVIDSVVREKMGGRGKIFPTKEIEETNVLPATFNVNVTPH